MHRSLNTLIAALSLSLTTANAQTVRPQVGETVMSAGLGAGWHEERGPARRPGSTATWLPAGRAACASLGLDADTAGSCTLANILNVSAQKTDKNLWFDKVSSTVGPPPEGCENAQPIQSFQTVANMTGTTFLCQSPPVDDHVTDAALAALQSRVTRLNAANPPTFADHQAAKEIKSFIGFYTKPADRRR